MATWAGAAPTALLGACRLLCGLKVCGGWLALSSGHIAQDMPGSIPHPEAKLGRARLVLW